MSDGPADTSGELDLGRYARRVAARWWIVALCVALAVGITLLRRESGNAPQLSEARAFVSIGQPLSPNGVPIPGTLTANVLFPTTFLSQAGVRDRAAREAGLEPGSLAGRVSTQAAGAAAARAGTSQQLFVTVRGPFTPEQAGAAANALSRLLVQETSRFQQSKLRLLTGRGDRLRRDIEALARDTTVVRARIARLEGPNRIDDLPRLILLNSLYGQLQANRGLSNGLREQVFDNDLLLASVRQVEQSRIVDEAEGRDVSGAASGSSGVVVATILGLVVGILLALLSTTVRPLRR